jgi:hypothetical protein
MCLQDSENVSDQYFYYTKSLQKVLFRIGTGPLFPLISAPHTSVLGESPAGRMVEGKGGRGVVKKVK